MIEVQVGGTGQVETFPDGTPVSEIQAQLAAKYPPTQNLEDRTSQNINPVQNIDQDVLSAITSASNEGGIDPSIMLAMAEIESNFNPTAQNKNSSAGGLYQFIDSTANRYGLKDKNDPNQSSVAAVQLANDNIKTLTQSLVNKGYSREDANSIATSPGGVYLSHQQGASGAAKLISGQGLDDVVIKNNYSSKVFDKPLDHYLSNPQDFAKDWMNKANVTAQKYKQPQGQLVAQESQFLLPQEDDNPSEFLSEDEVSQLPEFGDYIGPAQARLNERKTNIFDSAAYKNLAADFLTFSPEKRISQINETFGDIGINAVEMGDGNAIIYEDGRPVSILNKEGFSRRDVNPFAGTAVAFSPAGRVATAASTIPRALAAGSGASALTDVGLQATENVLAGEDVSIDPSRVAETAAFGAGGELLGRGVQAAGQFASAPVRSIVDRVYGGIEKRASGETVTGLPRVSQDSKEAARIAQEGIRRSEEITEVTGLPFTGSERTGSRPLSSLELSLKKGAKTSDIAQGFEVGRLKKANDFIADTLDGLAPNQSAITVGNSIIDSYNIGLKDARKIRSDQFKDELKVIKEQTNNERIFSIDNYTRSIDDQIDEIESSFLIDDNSKEKLNILNDFKSQLETKGVTSLNSTEINSLLSSLNSVAGKSGKLLTPKEAAELQVANKLRGAVNADLDEAAEGSDLMRQARDNYRTNSQIIDEYKNTTLKKLFKDENVTPERIVDQFLRLKPSEAAKEINLLKRVSPEIGYDLSRYAVDNILQKASANVPDGFGDDAFSFATFSTEWRKNKDVIKELMPSNEFKRLDTIAEGFGRVRDQFGTAGSPTGEIVQASELLNKSSLLDKALSGSINYVTNRSLARALFSTDGQEGLKEMLKKGATARDIAAGIGLVTSATASESQQ